MVPPAFVADFSNNPPLAVIVDLEQPSSWCCSQPCSSYCKVDTVQHAFAHIFARFNNTKMQNFLADPALLRIAELKFVVVTRHRFIPHVDDADAMAQLLELTYSQLVLNILQKVPVYGACKGNHYNLDSGKRRCETSQHPSHLLAGEDDILRPPPHICHVPNLLFIFQKGLKCPVAVCKKCVVGQRLEIGTRLPKADKVKLNHAF
mmetsp:Transcript_12965/g.18799  ORF Transcript_12965/g.18799 Transcript_12965/m.18799 type:complete len:205 (-) Transcript_12965:2315-2929(-)